MKTVLVTGGAGFIGSNFVNYLYNRRPNIRILVVDALTYAGNIDNLPEGGNRSDRYEFWYGDVRNGELMDALVSRADIVVHFAAESHVTRSIYDNRLFFETDVLGTQTVANAVTKFADRIERFIHISTSEVYGTAEAEEMDEDHPLRPMSPYASAKCGADRLVYSYWKTYGVPATILRPFNNYGPRQHLEKVIPRFITSCILGEPLTLHGDGSAARDFIYVEDVCRALAAALDAAIDVIEGEVFNIGTGRHRTILELAEAVRSRMGTEDVDLKYVGDRPGQVFRHTCDSAKSRALLGWEPQVSFEEGLDRTIRWYEENAEWWQRQLWMRRIPIITASGKSELH